MTGIVFIPLRVVVSAVGWVAWWMEVAADWLVGTSNRTAYVREGKCLRCGRCCHLLALEMPPFVARSTWLVSLAKAWHRVALNFHFEAREDRWLIYSCGYYADGEGRLPGRCRIYPFRHRLCRFFPRQTFYDQPELKSDCGYRFVRRDVATRRRLAASNGGRDFREVLKGKDSLR